jgi:hypothetical protein
MTGKRLARRILAAGLMAAVFGVAEAQQVQEVDSTAIPPVANQAAVDATPCGFGRELNENETLINLELFTEHWCDAISGTWKGLASLSLGLTEGEVAVGDAAGGAVGSPAFFWDDPGQKLGLGTSAPSASIEIARDGFDDANVPKVILNNTHTSIANDAIYAAIEIHEQDAGAGSDVGVVADLRWISQGSRKADFSLRLDDNLDNLVQVLNINGLTGNVGIGLTADAESRLHLSRGEIRINFNGETNKSILLSHDGEGGLVNALGTGPANRKLKLQSSTTFGIMIADGNVGIVNTAPQTALDLLGEMTWSVETTPSAPLAGKVVTYWKTVAAQSCWFALASTGSEVNSGICVP